MTKDRYEKMTDEDFDRILERLVSEMSAAQILAIGDVNMILREELNNAVLEEWEKENPEEEPTAEQQFYYDIMTTAVEGGSNYWAAFKNVKRDGALNVLSFELRDSEDPEPDEPWRLVNAEKVKAALEKLRDPSWSVQLATEIRQNIFGAYLSKDAGQIDAGDADIIVQIAVFEMVVYG